MNKQEIPIMFCFDNNYVIPAAVTFYSLLENCNKQYYYKLYVLHTDISVENQQKLKDNIKKFSEFSELIFINMENRFEDLWQTIKTKGHFSKEIIYKLLVSSIFPQYEKIIISDVDVVFLNDVSSSYLDLNVEEDYYLAGTKMIGKMKWYLDGLANKYSEKELEIISGFCAGYMIYNLKKLRKDNMEEKFIKCLEKEKDRVDQVEQDVLNLCCYPKTKKLPLKYVACTYMWDIYLTEEDKKTDIWYSKEEIEDAMENTVQLHYATKIKPWKNVDCTKSEIWFQYLAKTNYLEEYLKTLPQKIIIPKERIEDIKNEGAIEMRGVITHDIVNQIKFSYILKVKINNRLAKYRWFRIAKYIAKNPLFLFKKDFYKKLKQKIKNKFKNEEASIIILDDIFPSIYSPFRYEEYMEYFKKFKSVYALTTGISLKSLNEQRDISEVIKEFEENNPSLKNRVLILNEENKKKLAEIPNKVAIITFLQNLQNQIVDNIELLEQYKIPFIFTLYPGGGFILNDKESDEKLRRVCNSKYFKKVIVTQKIVYNYLIENNFCSEEQIEFLYGIVTPKEILNTKSKNKQYYKKNKDILDICFVAHKYSVKGEDKGYDLFIETAKKLASKYNDIRFHVIGGFNKEDIDVSELGEKIKFYGIKSSSWLSEFYQKMDLIVSPNRPFKLSKGSFDGFPTGSCTEAMINGVVLLCTDELKLNIKFKDKKDLIIIKLEVSNIVEEIEKLYNNPKKILKIARSGRNKAKNIYSKKEQLKPRIKLIKKVIKQGGKNE